MSETQPKSRTDALTTIIRRDRLETILDVLESVGDEAVLLLGQDGLQTSLVDPGNVYMADLSVDPDGFEFVGSGQFPIGVNLEALRERTSKADSDELIELSYDAETRKMNVSYSNVDISMACIDPDSIRDQPDLPDVEHPNTATMARSQLDTATDIAEMLSDHVAVECEPEDDRIAFRTEGDTDDMDVHFEGDELESVGITDETRSLFSEAYMNRLVDAVPNGSMVKIEVGDEFPLVAEFDIFDGDGQITAAIAPRIEYT